MTIEMNAGRQAGLAYLAVVVTGLFSLVYVPSRIHVPNDLAATLANMVRLQDLYRAGIAAFLVKQVAFLLLAALLYRLMAPARRGMAAAMVGLVAVSVPIALVSLVAKIDVLNWLTQAEPARLIGQEQLIAQAGLRLDAYRDGLLVTKLFWGLWLLPLAWLALESRCLPRLLAALLALGGLGYMADVFATLLVPGYPASGCAAILLASAAVGEIGSCLWLLAVGGHPATAGAAVPAVSSVHR